MEIMTCEWRKLIFANYQVPAELLERHLPPHTQLDYFNGKCYVSLVGFQFKNVKAAGVPIPFHTDFEEINLRFYVKRFDGNEWRHGVVFLREIVDRPALSVLANTFFNENYKTTPTSQMVIEQDDHLQAKYSWQDQKTEHSLWVRAENVPTNLIENSEEEFLIHRLWGYGKQDDATTAEYNINHPRWDVYSVKSYDLSVDFLQFGAPLSILNDKQPQSVFLAEGSKVEILGSTTITS